MTWGALRFRDYRRFWIGSFVANLGMWIQQIALGWLVYDLTRSATWLGIVGFCGNVPTLTLGLVGGAIADRASRRLMMITSALMLAGGAFALAALHATGALALWHIPAIAVVAGIATALYVPAMHAVIPSLVDGEHLLSAISLNSVQFNLARALGPAIAGLLYGAIGAAGCFTLNACGFVSLAGVLTTVRMPARPLAPAPPIGRALVAGIRYAAAHVTIAPLIALGALLSLLAFPYLVLLPALARDTLGLDATGLGYLMASMGAGAVIGGLAASAAGERMRVSVVAPLGSVVMGGLLVTFTLAATPLSTGVLLALTGAAQTITVASLTTRVQSDVDDGMRGRVMSMLTVVFFGLTTLGGLLGGLLADRIGVPPTFAVGGLATMTTALLLLRRVRRQRGEP